jgi:YVTN family beta-propeller protein
VGTQPYGVSVSPDGSTVYVSNYGSANVSVINAANNTVSANVAVGGNPGGISINPNGNDVYIALSSSNNVKVLNTATNTVTNTIAISGGSGALGSFIAATGCAGPTKTFTITAKPKPVASITASGSTTFCPLSSVTLTANGGTDYTYQWTKDGAPIIGQMAINYTASTSGSYNVIITSNGCTATASPLAISVSDTQAPVLVGVPSNTSAESDAIPAQAVVTATDNCIAGFFLPITRKHNQDVYSAQL